jgi:hypothetical protein
LSDIHATFERSFTVERSSDAVDGNTQGLVLPDSDNLPAGLLQDPIVPTIARDIAGNLRSPIMRVSLGGPPMFQASVPEAAVQKHAHPRSRKDDVRRTSEIGQRPTMLDEAQAQAMKGRSQSSFRTRVS